MQDAGCRMQDAGCRMQDAGCRMQDAGCRMHKIVIVDFSMSTIFLEIPSKYQIYS